MVDDVQRYAARQMVHGGAVGGRAAGAQEVTALVFEARTHVVVVVGCGR
ncbi:hypothetical protein ACWDBD_45805 [Streptomyces sp. NPDC001118]